MMASSTVVGRSMMIFPGLFTRPETYTGLELLSTATMTSLLRSCGW